MLLRFNRNAYRFLHDGFPYISDGVVNLDKMHEALNSKRVFIFHWDLFLLFCVLTSCDVCMTRSSSIFALGLRVRVSTVDSTTSANLGITAIQMMPRDVLVCIIFPGTN